MWRRLSLEKLVVRPMASIRERKHDYPAARIQKQHSRFKIETRVIDIQCGSHVIFLIAPPTRLRPEADKAGPPVPQSVVMDPIWNVKTYST